MATIIPLTGSVRERIMTCLRAAGWYEGRQTDLTAVKAFYASGGITLPKGAEAFLREYYGIAENWHLKATREKMTDSRLIGCAPEIFFNLYPHRGIPEINRDYFYNDEEDLADQHAAEEAAGEPLVQVGSIGYYYPAAVYLGSTSKIYTTHDYDDLVHCYDSVPEMLEYDFMDARKEPREWNFAAMQQVCYPLHDPRNVID